MLSRSSAQAADLVHTNVKHEEHLAAQLDEVPRVVRVGDRDGNARIATDVTDLLMAIHRLAFS